MADDTSFASIQSTSMDIKPDCIPKKRSKIKPDMETAISDTAISFDNSAAAFTQHADAQSAAPYLDENDDWLFVRLLYNKLRAIPNGVQKEMFKNRIDNELIWLTYGSRVQHQPRQQLPQHPPPASAI